MFSALEKSFKNNIMSTIYPDPKCADNIFARIAKHEIAATIVHETLYTMVIKDAHPKAPIHLLVIPRTWYQDVYDFMKRATPVEQEDVQRALFTVLDTHQLYKSGFKLVTNQGAFGHQEIPHYHIHILSTPCSDSVL